MEDVVLHYQSRSAEALGPLLERTEKLLEPFSCRTPTVFTPWFPTITTDRCLPIRPAKPAPSITASDDLLVSDSRLCIHTHTNTTPPAIQIRKRKGDHSVSKKHHDHDHLPSETPSSSSLEKTTRTKATCCVPANHHKLEEMGVTGLSPKKGLHRDKDAVTVTDSPIRRSWSVFTKSKLLLQSSKSLSKQFGHMVSVHRLHLRQRAKWIISENNCGATQDIEQVWRTLSRSVQRAELPTCNANIQRERAEIWVFCDILCSEQVGRFLKDELKLCGRIVLSVPRKGDVFSM